MSTYTPLLKLINTQKAIMAVKEMFAKSLEKNLNLEKVMAPLFVEISSGLNDDLDGIVRSVQFDTKSGEHCTIVHSLAKWKRFALAKFGHSCESGIYTDMIAIRKEEKCTPLHSYLVDQWDWEIVISKSDRKIEKFYSIVKQIYESFKEVEYKITTMFPSLPRVLPDDIKFISSQELEDKYPNLTPSERELKASKQYGAICVTQIGKLLKSGSKHDVRAPDYDDWDLNGDIIFYYEPLNVPFEISSMGIRVSEESLVFQLKQVEAEDREQLMFHRMLLNGELPYTIGGGIGQSRTVMFFLKTLHIGETHFSVWDEHTIKDCKEKGIHLL